MEAITNKRLPFEVFAGIFSVPISKHLLLWTLFLSTVAVIYLLPREFDYFFIIAVFFFFAVTKEDYIWLAYLVLLYDAPFGFFAEGAAEAAHRLPIFSFGSGLSFSTIEVFLFIGLIKALLKNNQVVSYFSSHYKILLIYLILLVGVALIVHEVSMSVFLDGLKNAFTLSFIFILYKLIDKREDQFKFIYLLLPFGFLILLDAIYFLVSGGDYIYNFFNPYETREVGGLGIEASNVLNIRFIVQGFILSYLIFIFSLSYSFIGRRTTYYLLAAVAAFIVILAGALRSWFVIYSIGLVFFIFYSSQKIRHSLVLASLVLLLFIPIFFTSTGSSAFSGAFQRVGTVFSLGKESSPATQRLENKASVRLPEQLQYIKENPVTGWAFTERKGDGDVGNFGLLVEVGFVGFMIFLWFWISYINILRKHIMVLENKNARNALRMLIVLFLGILLSHFTTNSMFGLNAGIFLGTLVFITEFIIQEAKLYDQDGTDAATSETH